MTTLTELPVQQGSPSDAIMDSPEKETKSVPSTDEESNEEGEELTGFGVEVDEIETLVVANDKQAQKSVRKPPSTIIKEQQVEVPVVPLSNAANKKGKKKSFRLFGKKRSNAPPMPAPLPCAPIPTMVETKSVDEVVSLLGSVPESVTRKSGPVDLDQSIEVSDAMLSDAVTPATDAKIARNNSIKPRRRRSMNPFKKKRNSNSGTTFDKDQNKSVPSVVMPQAITPPSSPLAFIGPPASQEEVVNQEPVESIAISKVQDSLQPEPSGHTTKPSQRNASDDESVEDVAAGIGRKWALFFHREKGEVDDVSDDSSQESDDDVSVPRAVPASDLNPDEIARLVSQGKEKVSEGDEHAPTPTEEARDDLPDKSGEKSGFYIPWNIMLPAGIISVQDDTGSVEVSEVSQDFDSVENAERDAVKNKEVDAQREGSPTENGTSPEIDGGDNVNSASPAAGEGLSLLGAVARAESFSPFEPYGGEEGDEIQDKYAVNIDAIAADIADEDSVESIIDDALRIQGAVQLSPHSMTLTDVDASAEDIQTNQEDNEETLTNPTANVGFMESTLAAIKCGLCVNNAGSVEVLAPDEDANKVEGKSSDDDTSTQDGTKPTGITSDIDEVNAETLVEITDGDDQPPAVTPSPPSDGIIARRKARLSALADSVSEYRQDDTASVEVSLSDASDTDSAHSSKRTFKEKLNTIVSKDIASRKTSGERSDGNKTKPDPQERRLVDTVDDESLVDREANAFFEQLDDESIEVSVVNEDVSTLASFPDSACFPQKPKYIHFEDPHEETLEENIEKRLCGLMPAAYRNVNIQQNTESKVSSAIEACEMMAVCCRGTADTKEKSVLSKSRMVFSANGNSVNDDLDTLDTVGEEDPQDPFAFLDYFDNATLDDSFWSAVDDGTLASVRSGSVRRFKQLLRENSGSTAGNSVKDSDRGNADDEGSEFDDSIFDTIVEEKPAQSEGEGVADLENSTKSPEPESSKKGEGAKEDAKPAVKTSKEQVPTDASATEKFDQKSRDKAIMDIRKAMATLQKYATKHGLSEPELLWKIQEEHKKRKAWSASMAEF